MRKTIWLLQAYNRTLNYEHYFIQGVSKDCTTQKQTSHPTQTDHSESQRDPVKKSNKCASYSMYVVVTLFGFNDLGSIPQKTFHCTFPEIWGGGHPYQNLQVTTSLNIGYLSIKDNIQLTKKKE